MESEFDFEIKNIGDILGNISIFKKHNHDVNPHWIIERKVSLFSNIKYGFKTFYKDGYFFNVSQWKILN